MKKYRTFLLASAALTLTVMAPYGGLRAQSQDTFRPRTTQTAPSTTTEDTRALYLGENGRGTATFPTQYTAKGFLDKEIVSSAGQNLGDIQDILVTPQGQAMYIVVASNGLFTGKDVLLNYAAAVRQEPNGDILVPVTEDNLKQGKEFDKGDRANPISEQLRTGSLISIKDLLGRDIITTQNNVKGEVDNITFKGGRADYVILGFDKTLGMGGEKAALPFSQTRWNHQDEKHQISLTETQTQRLAQIAETQKRNR